MWSPAAILKDGGSDLGKGVELYALEQALRNESLPIVLRDVGHVAANALKALYKRNEVLGKFLALVEKARDLMRQSSIAALSPPKLRTKCRYQSISRAVEWAGLMAWQMGGRGRVPEGNLRAALLHLGQLIGSARRRKIPSKCGSLAPNAWHNQLPQE